LPRSRPPSGFSPPADTATELCAALFIRSTGRSFTTTSFAKKPLERRYARTRIVTEYKHHLKIDRLTGEVHELQPGGTWQLIGVEIPKEYQPTDRPPTLVVEYSDDGEHWDTHPKASVELCKHPVPASEEPQQTASGVKGGAAPQVSKGEAKNLDEAASQSRANLLSASNAYRESLEKLLELQRQDESRAATIVERRKELLARGVIEKRELEEGERALAEAQGKISETMRKIAEVDQLMAEVNAAEKMAAKKPAAKKAKKGSAK